MTDMDRNVYIPDDLEERWAEMDSYAKREVIDLYRQRNAEGRLTWQQRRRIRKLIGEPLTVGTAAEVNARSLDEQDRDRKRRHQLLRTYGKDGYQEIKDLAHKLEASRPGVPEERAVAWAEKVYLRERNT